MEARSGEEEISGDEEPADGEDIVGSVSIHKYTFFHLCNFDIDQITVDCVEYCNYSSKTNIWKLLRVKIGLVSCRDPRRTFFPW